MATGSTRKTKRTRARRAPLTEYRRKRDFARTAEPSGDGGTSPKPTRRKHALAFVIQKHAASHLHFDLRLELDGVMKSWAVPKGPSRDPSVKRLAMHVEDHPIDYNTFEGTIPKGQYGGGTVMIWDQGTYEPAEGDIDSLRTGYAKGSLKFTLHGERLTGSWALVRMKGQESREWLLIKHADESVVKGDEFATEDSKSAVSGRTMEKIAEGDDPQWQSNRPTPASSAARAPASRTVSRTALSLRPMLATIGDSMPTGKNWAFEPKYDGIRVLAFTVGESVALMTRNDRDKAAQFPEVVEALIALSGTNERAFVLDGEIVARKGKSLARFQDLQSRIGQTSKTIIANHARNNPATLVAFDLLLVDGKPLIGQPWTERREALESLLEGDLEPGLQLGEAVVGSGAKLMTRAKRGGWEGIMAKRADSAYVPDTRTRDWLKLKIEGRQEFVVGGWTEPRRSRQHIGSLLLGYWKDGDLMYAGHVGGGFTQETLRSTHSLLAPLERKSSPFADDVDTNEPAHWTTPKVVVEVKFNEWTAEGKLRQPIFLGVRDDKDPKTIVRES
jgi:bifunctional non-homologous end joining protein LigD